MDKINIAPAESGATGPNDQQMADLGASLTNQEAPSRPEWLPEGFDSPEALAAAYAEMAKAQQQAPAAKPNQDKATDAASSEDTSKSDENNDSVTFEEFVAEALQSGDDLTPEAYAALEAAGYSKAVVDRYVSAVNAEAQAVVNAAYETAGGEDQYAAMVKWAQVSLAKDEIDAFNKVTNSGDVGTIKLAIEGLKTKYTAANGNRPAASLNGGNGSGAGGGYTSWAEVTSAMSDPRYNNDPAYRQQVEQRILKSGALM